MSSEFRASARNPAQRSLTTFGNQVRELYLLRHFSQSEIRYAENLESVQADALTARLRQVVLKASKSARFHAAINAAISFATFGMEWATLAVELYALPKVREQHLDLFNPYIAICALCGLFQLLMMAVRMRLCRQLARVAIKSDVAIHVELTHHRRYSEHNPNRAESQRAYRSDFAERITLLEHEQILIYMDLGSLIVHSVPMMVLTLIMLNRRGAADLTDRLLLASLAALLDLGRKVSQVQLLFLIKRSIDQLRKHVNLETLVQELENFTINARHDSVQSPVNSTPGSCPVSADCTPRGIDRPFSSEFSRT